MVSGSAPSGTLYDWQPSADRSDTDRLDQRRDARGEQGNLHKNGYVLRSRGKRDNQGNRNVAGEHREDVLYTERYYLAHRSI